MLNFTFGFDQIKKAHAFYQQIPVYMGMTSSDGSRLC